MLQWLSQNLATIIICLMITAVVTAIIIKKVKDKKQGKSSCGCGCSGCPMSSVCGKKSEADNKKTAGC